MSFRNKLLVVLAAATVLSTLAISIAMVAIARAGFERQEHARSASIALQFEREFARAGDDVVSRVTSVARSEAVRRMALDEARARTGAYLGEAALLAPVHRLDFLELLSRDGAILSSAEFPARFGYRDEWAPLLSRLTASGASLRRQNLPNASELGIFAVRSAAAGDQPVYVVGGVRLDPQFIAGLAIPADTQAQLVIGPQELAPGGTATPLENLAVQAARSGDDAEAIERNRALHVVPLKAATGEVLAVLAISTSRQELARMEQHILSVALLVGGLGIVLSVLTSGWIAARVTRPVEQLAAGAARVAEGDLGARVDAGSSDELGQLARAFNHMTAELLGQRERLVQAERVAAWRELARRLAHELKNPLFPLQITVENMVRARESHPGQFDEIFRESTATLLAELQNLRTIVGRFSDFSKMPRPQLEPAAINEIVRQAVKTHGAQLRAAGEPIAVELQLDPAQPMAEADPALLHRALSNLLLNAIDAMPQGGALRLRTHCGESAVTIEVSDTGAGMTPEECSRLFTPYYTSKLHGTGLGLAIVQSVVSDHGGSITVQSNPGRGTTFRIELPKRAHPPQESL
ncbi:MAG: HAMP domain-containing protein [Acidobacteria bacterium]|nr:HAMP domain-containing protein [Acidobacteriota bacterium]